jgi:Tfp pilus assembly protein PilO
MTNLAETRKRYIIILAVMGALDLLLMIYLFLPGSRASSKLAEERRLQEQVTALTHEVSPLRDIGEKLITTRGDIKKFYEQKVPSQFSQISQHLEKLTQESGVSMPAGIHYSQTQTPGNEKNELPDVQRIGIDTTVTGEYTKVAKFINAMEQDKFVFIIDQISLNSQESGVISLQIKFETFLKQT